MITPFYPLSEAYSLANLPEKLNIAAYGNFLTCRILVYPRSQVSRKRKFYWAYIVILSGNFLHFYPFARSEIMLQTGQQI